MRTCMAHSWHSSLRKRVASRGMLSGMLPCGLSRVMRR
jgi:hypothetical protein